jgi:hypothetical protein
MHRREDRDAEHRRDRDDARDISAFLYTLR